MAISAVWIWKELMNNIAADFAIFFLSALWLSGEIYSCSRALPDCHDYST